MFGIAVGAGLQVEHELRQRPFQPRQLPLHDHETRAGDLCRSFEIHQPQPFADVEMLARLVIQSRGWLSPAPHFDVAGLVLAVRHVIERNVGNDGQCRLKRLVELALDCLARGNEVLDRAHLGFKLLGAGLVARLHRLADFLRGGIAPGLRILQFLHMVAPFGIDLQQLRRHWRQARGGPAPCRMRPDCREWP